jgi:fucose 4-O-acetylase-like acetyltransferase
VVWGHFLESRGFDDTLYFVIYVIHMPAFVMISGMFSKSRLTAQDALRVCRRVLPPLVIFQVLYLVVLTALAPRRAASAFVPAWIVWFLFSLLTWRLLLPWVLRLPQPLALSVLVALTAGYVDAIGPGLSLSRTLVFFPAFLVGHLHGERIREAVVRHRLPLSALFVVTLCGSVLVSSHADIRWLWGSRPYSAIPTETPGMLFRAAAILAGITSSVAFLAVLPTRSRTLAWLGERTLPIYLCHGFPVIAFWATGWQLDNDVAFAAVTAGLAVALTVAIAGLTEVVTSWATPT